ncbi:hypothetical protein LTR49_025116 [Elasticomyces elasticus]|nr:hypothetical protein LTR49_025116 [Elasticomyces elasticus]
MCGLDKLVKISVRQSGDGPQPGVLKNAMYALVGAVWSQAQDWSHTVAAMVNLGLLCRTELGVDPSDLNEPISTSDLFRAVKPYQAPSVQSEADKGSLDNGERLEEDDWENLVRLDDHDATPMELECTIPQNIATLPLTPPSSAESQRASICEGISINLLHETPTASPLYTHERLHGNSWDHLNGMHAVVRADSVEEAMTFPYERAASAADPSSSANGLHQSTWEESGGPEAHLSDDAHAGFHALGANYYAAITGISTKHNDTLLRVVQCIGSSSAVFSLRLVVSNFRGLHVNQSGKQNATRIAAPRSCAERMAAIDDLSACMSHYALARRMHIYMLYKEALEQTGQCVDITMRRDPFILESGNSPPRGRGNPLNKRRAAVTRNMMVPGQSSGRVGKLRRLGQRLDILVRTSGRGIYGLLDENLSPEMIMKVSDAEFDAFVETVDRFEGDRIRYISERSLLIVNMLFDDCDNGATTTFRIESLHYDSVIIQES